MAKGDSSICDKCGLCCQFLIIKGDIRKYDKQFFRYHGIDIKEIDGELWYKIPIPCKHFNFKLNLCKIHGRKPKVCRDAGCIKNDEKFPKEWLKEWGEK